jgi:hypothetical protein
MIKNPKNIETWLKRHRDLGICHFYIRLEETPELEDYLRSQKDVTLYVGKSKNINEYEEIQTRQNTFVNKALREAENDSYGVKWLIHIDCDEILKGDLNSIENLPENTRTFWFKNEEAKFNKVPTKEDNCFNASKMEDCSKQPNKCVSYGNGKSGGRVASDVFSNGPHRMKSTLKGSTTIKLDSIKVEHYESCDFNIYKKKFQHLANQNRESKIPFSYYNESIKAANSMDEQKLYDLYKKYRTL